jgi:hypothetical protein
MRKEKRKGGHVYNTASWHCCFLFLLVLHCPIFIKVSVEQLFKYGEIFLAILPFWFSAPTCPTALPSVFCDFKRIGGGGLIFYVCLFVCFSP